MSFSEDSIHNNSDLCIDEIKRNIKFLEESVEEFRFTLNWLEDDDQCMKGNLFVVAKTRDEAKKKISDFSNRELISEKLIGL